MLTKMYWRQAVTWKNVYNDPAQGTQGGDGGQGEGNKGGGDGTHTDPPAGTGTDEGDDKPRFTQKQLNTLLAEEKRKAQKRVEDQIKQLEELKKSKSLTEKEKTDLHTQIEELRTSTLTKEELAAKERDRILKEHKTQVETLSSERDSWRNNFTQSRIERDILDEASKTEAYNPRQIVNLLRGDTRLAEATDSEGNIIPNQYVVKIKMDDVDKEGKPVTLDLTVPEALKRMKDRPDEFGNLFKSGVNGGLGANTNKGSKPVNPKDMTHDQYMKHRASLGLGAKQE